MLPFERSDLYFPGLAADQIVPLLVPGRLFVQKLIAVQVAAGAFNMFLYNRGFTNPQTAINKVVNNGGFAQVKFDYPHIFTQGDQIVISNNHVDYNGSHTIEQVIGAQDVVLTTAYGGSDRSGGEATLLIGVHKVVNNDGFCEVWSNTPHLLKAGDHVVLAGTSVVGYNTTHIVVRVLDAKRFVTTVAYSADSTFNSGNITRNISSAAQKRFEVIGSTAASGGAASFLVDTQGRPLCSQDVPRSNQGFERLAYLKVSASGDYLISIGGGLEQG